VKIECENIWFLIPLKAATKVVTCVEIHNIYNMGFKIERRTSRNLIRNYYFYAIVFLAVFHYVKSGKS
jgi:hypothetical protein